MNEKFDKNKNKKRTKQTITKRKREGRFRNYKMGAFDFETTALDGSVCFGTLQFELKISGERSPILDVYSASGMLDLLFENSFGKIRWFAHNLEYDLLFLLQEGNKRLERGELLKIELFERGMGNFYKAIFHGKERNIELYDSMALFGFSLDVFTAQFSKIGKKKSDLINFEIESFDINNPSHIEYARHDTASLLDAMFNLDEAFYSLYGVHLKGTISATALAAWEVTLESTDKFFKPTRVQSDFFRNGYFGGLVFITDDTPKRNIVSLDFNSMYPYCMRKYGVPINPLFTTKVFIKDRPGIYHAKFTAPKNLDFGCIGYRDKKGVSWPRGAFESYAFDFEIARALAWGYKIEIVEGVIFESIAYPFSDFVEKCESYRAEYKGTAFEIVVKLAQNSIYGKFGTKEDGKEIVMCTDDSLLGDGFSPYLDTHAGGLPIEHCYEKATERDTYYMLPHWAAYITARARHELLSLVELAGGNALYGDTDSIKMPESVYIDLLNAGLLRVGNEYGALKLDAEYKTFRAIAPKVYAYTDKDEKLGGRGKGIPEKHRTAEFWQSVFIGEHPTVSFNSMGKLHSVLKSGGDRKLIERTRTSTDLGNSDSWFSENGRVKSVFIENEKRLKR